MGNRPSLGYIEKEIQDLQYKIISTFDGEEVTRKFIDEHTENAKFRNLAVEYAVAEKDYNRAIDLCLGGEKESVNSPGLLENWKKMRYDIYEKTDNTSEQKKLAYEFTLSGDFDFYLKLRNLYSSDSAGSDDFFDIFENILSEMRERPQSIYTKILIHENMKPELLEYCTNNTHTVIELYKHLLPDYEAEVDKIFLEYIYREASQASERSQYRSVCNIIREYAKACGNEAAAKVTADFKVQYVKRPAFIDELKKT